MITYLLYLCFGFREPSYGVLGQGRESSDSFPHTHAAFGPITRVHIAAIPLRTFFQVQFAETSSFLNFRHTAVQFLRHGRTLARFEKYFPEVCDALLEPVFGSSDAFYFIFLYKGFISPVLKSQKSYTLQ